MGLAKKTKKEDPWSKRDSRAKHFFPRLELGHPELTQISASLCAMKDPRIFFPDSSSLVRWGKSPSVLEIHVQQYL